MLRKLFDEHATNSQISKASLDNLLKALKITTPTTANSYTYEDFSEIIINNLTIKKSEFKTQLPASTLNYIYSLSNTTDLRLQDAINILKN